LPVIHSGSNDAGAERFDFRYDRIDLARHIERNRNLASSAQDCRRPREFIYERVARDILIRSHLRYG
jgi:hypothetical protein